MLSLSFETSCDETSAAVLDNDDVLSNIISSQAFHNQYGGVIPELASREHLKNICIIADKALNEAGIILNQIELIGATSEPGLIGALFIGLNYAKSLSYSLNAKFIPVNHLHAHIYSSFLGEKKPEFPFLALIISGGHTVLILVKNFFEHIVLGTTLDDAAGEAFDKVAKMLGLGYPGGPYIDEYSRSGDENFYRFPRPRIKSNYQNYNFSFSGIKTSVLYYLKEIDFERIKEKKLLSDICASFQYTMIESLLETIITASNDTGIKNIVISGGVSSNKYLRKRLDELSVKGYNIHYPLKKYTTDNAAMVGITAYYSYKFKYNDKFIIEKLFKKQARPKSDLTNI